MRDQFEEEIKKLNEKQEQAVETLLLDFNEQLARVQEMYEESKKNGDGLKMKNEEKLTSQDYAQDQEYQDLEDKHKQVLQKL